MRKLSLALVFVFFFTPQYAVQASGVISTGTYSENANSDDAPLSRDDMAGNFKGIKAEHLANGTLKVTIDYWAAPSNRYILKLKWCTYLSEYRRNIWTGDDSSFLCDVSDPNYSNYAVYFEPALSTRGNQLGLRKSFKGTIKKGVNKNQYIYTVTGNLFKNSAVVGLDASMHYSSSSMERVTTSCSGSYSISCSTSRSSIFDVDEVLLELTTVSSLPERPAAQAPKPVPTKSSGPSTSQSPVIGSATTIQSYFDRVEGQFNVGSRRFQIECINDAPRAGSVKDLRALMVISSHLYGTAPGKEWFPKDFTPEFKDRIKTWPDGDKSLLYIELEFSASNSNPCGMIFQNIPRLAEIGSDVNHATFVVAGSTGFAVASKALSKIALG
jgi:hypothetical protein